MTRDLYALAARLQDQLLRASASLPPDTWAKEVPRVMVDAWATLSRWHQHGERVWRITPAAADETADMLLPPDLALATARTRGEAVAYQLPERSEWIVIARHAPAPCTVTVRGPDVGWAYAQPVLTYCTELADGALAAGYYNLIDQPTPARLELRPGTTLGLTTLRALSAADIAEDEYRVALALVHHYFP